MTRIVASTSLNGVKISIVLMASAIALLCTSCAITRPLAISSNPIGNKVGMASSQSFLGGLLFDGDASIQAAAKQGNITRVATVDVKTINVFYIFIKHTTIVTGE